VLDFDDLHMPSPTHVSVVCVPVALAASPRAGDGGARAYLAAAGVMARLGTALGWRHYTAGWHATCTAGAQADPTALDAWLGLVGGDFTAIDPSGPLIPNGLAIKLYPCCYALQRPIAALAELDVDPGTVRRIVLRTPEATVVPLIHHRPETGLEGKFSLEYAAAAALLDHYPVFASFTDEAVRRDAARRLAGLVETKLEPGGDGLLDGARCTSATGPCGGSGSSSRRGPRRGRRPVTSCGPSWTTAWVTWPGRPRLVTRPSGPGRMFPAYSGGSCHGGERG
jgi:2-methylcitrate dehydratase PrpD